MKRVRLISRNGLTAHKEVLLLVMSRELFERELAVAVGVEFFEGSFSFGSVGFAGLELGQAQTSVLVCVQLLEVFFRGCFGSSAFSGFLLFTGLKRNGGAKREDAEGRDNFHFLFVLMFVFLNQPIRFAGGWLTLTT